MTVETTTRRVIANGNGIATSFSFNPMVIYQSSDLVVVKRDTLGVETVLAEGTGASDYAVVVTTYPGTGTITFPASGTTLLASGEKLAIVPRISIKQETDLDNQGGYFADVQELQFDKLVHIDQQQQEQIARALKINVSDNTVTSTELGALTANYVLAVNADATGFLWSASMPGNVTVSAFMATVLDDTTAAAARTTLGAQPLDASLTAIAALTTAADKFIYFSAADTPVAGDITAFARTILDDADAATVRTTIGALSSADRGVAQAFVSFTTVTTTAIQGTALNVSSLTDNGAGDTTINFTSALAGTNYTMVGTASGDDTQDGAYLKLKTTTSGTVISTKTTTACRVTVVNVEPSIAATDRVYVGVAIFGGA